MRTHYMQYRVPYADTDQMGVVYYANYLVYFERSRTELLRDANLPYSKLEQDGVFLPVSEAYCKYLASARYDDLLTFKTQVEEVKGVRIKMSTEVLRGETVLARGYVVLACVNREGKLVRPPETLCNACE
ncbi:MAG: acyl-CoA thioesterase [Victivallaceae bacterium]